jgi:TonB family protein
MTEVGTKWDGEVVKGVFPLRRFLNGSDHSAVFLTDHPSQSPNNAAIKIIPADRVSAEAQLALWRSAAALSHPHLIRLLDSGHWQFGGQQFLFVVMEYAEETLAQILPQRALTPNEVREMLLPSLDALAFLHRKSLVQGQLKPANFLVVGDQLKLASDTVRPVGESTAQIARFSLYDPPEARSGTVSAAGDIWGLGVTTVEALTQHPPAWQNERFEIGSWPATLPPTFADAVQRCLSRNPANRPTAADLAALFKLPPASSAVSVPQPVVREASGRAAAAPTSPRERVSMLAIAAVLIVFVAAWAGLRLFRSHPNSQQSAPSDAQTSSQQAAAPAAAASQSAATLPAPPEISAPSSRARSTRANAAPSRRVSPSLNQSVQPSAEASAAVVHEEIPAVPHSARETIRGHIKVVVRVIVDRSGNVIDALLQNPGPSGYFARLAREASRKWKFVASDTQDSRQWLLTFEFTRGGTTAHSVVPRS